MPGKAVAVNSGLMLRNQVIDLGRKLGLEAKTEVKVGRRIWGAIRRIDVVLVQRETRQSLGIECKYQSKQGTAEEKIPATIQDIRTWPIRGIVVFAGEGFTDNMRSFLYSTGLAVEFVDLESWLSLFFGIENTE